jgi:hypothetical protein
MNHENPVVAFARDFSGADAAIMTQVKSWVADPPPDARTIGFYGSDSYEPRTRLFLATVHLLSDKGKIYSVEDKYTYEIFDTWRDDNVIDPATLPSAAKAVFGPWTRMEEIPDFDDEAVAAAYRKTVESSYAKATEELEQHIGSRGRVLLSVDATNGDTMFFAVVEPDIAERWRDKALSEQDGYRAGVRSPMWDRFYTHMAYAVPDDVWAAEDQEESYPPGTRLRSDVIPFAE